MTSVPHALQRLGAAVFAFALAVTLVVSVAPRAEAQQSPEFSDLDQTIHADAIRLVAEDGITQGYPDGTYRPRDDVRRDQMATFLMAALQLDPRTPDFPDVPSENVHFQAIGAIARAGVTSGYPDGTYRPRGFVTRGQMATFLAAGLDLPEGDATFSDVPSDYVHADAIAALADSGITQGFPDGTFRPNALVKRDQMAAFLANGIPLPRELPCPGSNQTTAASNEGQATTSSREATAEEEPEANASAFGEESEDLVELESGDVFALTEDLAAAAAPSAPSESLGPAVPGTSFPLTSVIATANDRLEVHTQDLPTSRGARVQPNGDVSATTTIPAGRRTWATARIGNTVYAGQWGAPAGTANLYRYDSAASGSGNRTAAAVATVPTGGEFWTLTVDGSNRLWAGTRAHADGDFRTSIGLRSGRNDGRHVVHRIDPSSGRVTNVTFCLPDPPTNAAGARPDIKHLTFVGSTLYVGTGQQAGSTRLYAFEPGDRTDIPAGEVRDLTPSGIGSATGVFAMASSDRYVAFGTQASSGSTARLAVIDRQNGERARLNVQLTGENRVDAVALRGNRVVATGFSGQVYDLTIPTSGTRTNAPTASETIEPPVARQFHRFVQIREDGSLRGVTQQGVVWTRPNRADAEVDRVNLVDTGAPVAPGLPHSLHLGAADVAVGASSALTLRDAAAPDADPRTVNISGEAKAITSNDAGDTFVATYPNATLWRVEAGGDEAEELRPWTATFTRPADADFDRRRNRVNVIAREEGNQMSEGRTSPQANFGFRPSRLFSLHASVGGRTSGFPLGRAGTLNSPVAANVAAGTPVEASTILSGTTPGGSEVFIGDTRGGVQRVNATDGQRQWYVPADSRDADRPVVDIEMVDGRLVVVHSGFLNRRSGVPGPDPYAYRTVVRELDPTTGEQLAYHHVQANEEPIEFAQQEALTSGSVTVFPSRTINRYFDRSTGVYEHTGHTRNDSFGGPYVALDRDRCVLYSFERRPSHLVRTPFDRGECGDPLLDPEDPVDPTDPIGDLLP